MFFKIGVLKIFTNFTEHLCWSLFLIKLQAFRPDTEHRIPPMAVSVSSLNPPFLCKFCNILKFCDKITLEKIFSLSLKYSTDNSIFWLVSDLYFEKIYIDTKLVGLHMTKLS